MSSRKSIAPASKTSADLAVVARRIRERYQAFTRRTWTEAAEIGQELLDNQAKLNHGEWLPWLAETGISRSTAGRLMALAPLLKLPNLGNLALDAPVSSMLKQVSSERQTKMPKPVLEADWHPVDQPHAMAPIPNAPLPNLPLSTPQPTSQPQHTLAVYDDEALVLAKMIDYVFKSGIALTQSSTDLLHSFRDRLDAFLTTGATHA